MAKKYYVVWEGRNTGIYTTWVKCKVQVDSFSGARFKSFSSLEEAESAFSGKPAVSVEKSKTTKTKNSKPKPSPLSQEQINEMQFEIKIFTDGACAPNPGEAGTGLAIYENNILSELWYGLYQSLGTNNTAELNGLYQAILLAKEKLSSGLSVAIFSDSKYSIDCITKWAKGWEKKGWTKKGGEIKNLDIIKPAYALYTELSTEIVIHHVNGHVGIEGNELADRMAMVAIEYQNSDFSLYRATNDISEILALREG